MTASLHEATDPGFSAWVSANAGAGKTYLLTDRVTRLLLSGASPSRILCLTYTKAAAAEMATRLFSRLGEWALLSDGELTARLLTIGAAPPDKAALRRARTLFAQALETPGGLKIQTIHSFCQHILARFPVEAGIPARFTVLDERSTGELMAEARNAVLEQAAAGDSVLAKAVALLATRAADGRFAEILNFALGDGARLRALLAEHNDEPERFFAHLRKTMGIAPGEDETQIVNRFRNDVLRDQGQFAGIAAWLRSGSSTEREFATRFAAFLDPGADDSGYEQLLKAFLTGEGVARKRLVT
jgi:ATP-dependent helicase/nuclease subunit A